MSVNLTHVSMGPPAWTKLMVLTVNAPLDSLVTNVRIDPQASALETPAQDMAPVWNNTLLALLCASVKMDMEVWLFTDI